MRLLGPGVSPGAPHLRMHSGEFLVGYGDARAPLPGSWANMNLRATSPTLRAGSGPGEAREVPRVQVAALTPRSLFRRRQPGDLQAPGGKCWGASCACLGSDE